MELRWGSSVGSALVLLLGLLIAWPFVVGAASGSQGETSLTFQGSTILDDLASLADDATRPHLWEGSSPAGVAEPGTGPRAMSEPQVSRPTVEFVDALRGAGLVVSAGGDRILTHGAGAGTARQLALSQAAADRFGIMKNPFVDPSRVAAIRNGRSIVDLSTGVIMGHEIVSSMFGTTEVVPMDVLEELRGNVGWSITADRELLAATYDRVFGYVPVYLQSDAVYAQYVESARANYETQAGAA
jgi:hypothetical protein